MNEALYRKTVAAIRDACQHFGIKESVKVHVYSANSNPKIPKGLLHEALLHGGAGQVETDPRSLVYRSGSNDNERRARIDTDLHIATLKF